jgi:hypothetical protein
MVRSALVVGLAAFLVACGEDAPKSPPPVAPASATPAAPGAAAPTPTAAPSAPASTLEALVARFQAACAAGDEAQATALATAMVPTKDDLAAVLAPGTAAAEFVAAWKFGDVPPDALKALGRELFAPGDPKHTETHVHAATTEEIVANREGSVAFAEFPGGMKRFAALAAPGRTWYVVELVAPGSSTGMKYTCFTRVGDRWIFLPKPWRAVPDAGK